MLAAAVAQRGGHVAAGERQRAGTGDDVAAAAGGAQRQAAQPAGAVERHRCRRRADARAERGRIADISGDVAALPVPGRAPASAARTAPRAADCRPGPHAEVEAAAAGAEAVGVPAQQRVSDDRPAAEAAGIVGQRAVGGQHIRTAGCAAPSGAGGGVDAQGQAGAQRQAAGNAEPAVAAADAAGGERIAQHAAGTQAQRAGRQRAAAERKARGDRAAGTDAHAAHRAGAGQRARMSPVVVTLMVALASELLTAKLPPLITRLLSKPLAPANTSVPVPVLSKERRRHSPRNCRSTCPSRCSLRWSCYRTSRFHSPAARDTIAEESVNNNRAGPNVEGAPRWRRYSEVIVVGPVGAATACANNTRPDSWSLATRSTRRSSTTAGGMCRPHPSPRPRRRAPCSSTAFRKRTR